MTTELLHINSACQHCTAPTMELVEVAIATKQLLQGEFGQERHFQKAMNQQIKNLNQQQKVNLCVHM